MARKLSAGDIMEVVCANGQFAYIAYVGKDDNLGDTIWVVPQLFSSRPTQWSDVFSRPGYYAYYPANLAIYHKLVTNVGFALEAMHTPPQWSKNAIGRNSDGVYQWVITDGITRIPRPESEISDEERKLPIRGVWNHPSLCAHIEQGWTPETHGHKPIG